MYRNLVTEMSPDRNGSYQNGSDQNGQTETARPNRPNQWRTQKIFMGGFHSVAYGVICIWCPLFVTL